MNRLLCAQDHAHDSPGSPLHPTTLIIIIIRRSGINPIPPTVKRPGLKRVRNEGNWSATLLRKVLTIIIIWKSDKPSIIIIIIIYNPTLHVQNQQGNSVQRGVGHAACRRCGRPWLLP